MNMNQSLRAVVNTLNTIEVHGESNLNSLLGCIQVLNNIISEIDKETENKQAASR